VKDKKIIAKYNNNNNNIIQLVFINVQTVTTHVPVTRPTQKQKHNTGSVEIHKNETLNRQNKNSTNTKKLNIKQAKQKLYKYTETTH
jgi:hypothetical protein